LFPWKCHFIIIFSFANQKLNVKTSKSNNVTAAVTFHDLVAVTPGTLPVVIVILPALVTRPVSIHTVNFNDSTLKQQKS
jgi:hypothetical protein